ncbi:MAG: response regulator, partial [Spirochaetaceae bacterium]|nr:response regulator [Spirochaetaceae bacterium]
MVEDSPEHLDLLIGMLDGTYHVQMATAGVPALKLAAAEGRPDLILLDIVMPGMDGLEVCRRLKHDKRTRDIPVILLTAQTASESKRKGFELGAADYITKPYDPAEVMMRVNAQLTLRR